MVKKRHVGAAVTIATVAVASRAYPHPELSPQLVNRYLSVIVSDDPATGASRADVAYTLMYGELPGADLRRAMDTNGDGRVSPGELDAETQRVRSRAAALFSLTIDGRPATGPVEGNVQLGAEDAVSAAPVVVELYAPRPLPEGTRRLRVEAGEDPPRLGETEMTLDLGARWELLSGARGTGGDQKLTRAKFEGARKSTIEDRSMTFVIRTKGALATPTSPGGTVPLPVYAAAAAVLFAGSATALALHLRQRRRRVSAGRTTRGS